MNESSQGQGSSLPLSVEERLDTVCRRFEQAWQQGQRPDIGRYLAEAPPEVVQVLLRELVALELTYRRRADERPTPEEYFRRFPGHTVLLEELLAVERAEKTCLDPTTARPRRPPVAPDPVPEGGPRYRPLHLHARGGLGEIQVAEDRELRREVALKRILPHRAHDPASRARFLREAEITGRLEHPGVVPVYGLIQDDQGQPSYAMRFVEGQTLQQAIRSFHQAEGPRRDPAERRLALRELLGRWVAVCNTVAYAHSRGVLHRDLKPVNIILGKYGETLVVDWGLAKVMATPSGPRAAKDEAAVPTLWAERTDVETQVGTVAGTPSYMSPEQAGGQVDLLGPASDVYSLGATLYEILTNRPPAEGSAPDVVVQQVLLGVIPRPSRVNRFVPPALEAVCLKAMALHASERYATATELARDVERWLADDPVSVYRGPASERLLRWARRHRPAVVGVAVLGLATLAGVGLLAWQSERGRQELLREQAATSAAHRLAEENAGRERRAIRDYFVRATQDPAWGAVGLEPLRKKLLQDARDYFQGFIQRHGDKPELQEELAEAHALLGAALVDLGDRKGAGAEFEAGLALYARLAEGHPGEPRFPLEQANLWNALGEQRRAVGDRPGARAAYARAQELGERLTAEYPREPKYLRTLAGIHNNHGEYFKEVNETKAARRAYEQAVESYRQLTADHPRNPAYQDSLALSYSNLGVLLRSQEGDLAGARRAYDQAIALLEQLVKEHPREARYQWSLGMALHNLANLFGFRENVAEALALYRRALELNKQLARRHPAVPEYTRDLAMSYRSVGSCLQFQRDLTGARQAYEECLALRERLVEEHPDVPAFRDELARVLGVLGVLLVQQKDYPGAKTALDKAEAAWRQLVAQFGDVPNYRLELANNYNYQGYLLTQQNDQPGVQRCLEQARDLLEELAARYPRAMQHRRELARVSGNLGDCLRHQGNQPAARRAYERCVALWGELAAQDPETPLNRQRLALNRSVLSELLKEMGLWEEAAAGFRQALPDWEQVVAKAPRDLPSRRHHAGNQTNLGLALHDLGRPGEAEVVYRQALALLEKMLTEFGGNGPHALDLGATYGNLGTLVRDGGRLEQSLEWYDKGVRLVRPLLTAEAHRAEARANLRNQLEGRAEALARLGRAAEAVKDLDEALALDGGATRALLRARRALAQNDPAAAVAAAYDQSQDKAVSGPTLYQCARVCARAAQAEKKDPQRSEKYAAQAVALLRRAADLKFPIAYPVKNNPDLDPVRDRDDFRALMQEVEKTGEPLP